MWKPMHWQEHASSAPSVIVLDIWKHDWQFCWSRTVIQKVVLAGPQRLPRYSCLFGRSCSHVQCNDNIVLAIFLSTCIISTHFVNDWIRINAICKSVLHLRAQFLQSVPSPFKEGMESCKLNHANCVTGTYGKKGFIFMYVLNLPLKPVYKD